MSATTSSFEAWPHNHVQGEPIDTLGVPFDDKFFAENFEAVIGPIEEDETTVYRRVGSDHMRSYEVVPGRSEGFEATAVWFDRYGNPYTSLSTKGNNFSRQDIMRSGTAPSGYIPFGLQESDALLRVVKASRILREASIDTEWIVRVIEPKQLQFNQERVDQETFKRRLLSKVISEAGVEVDLRDSEPQVTADEIAKIRAALNGMSFFVTLRAMSISDRPGDLIREDASAATNRLSRVFDIINTLGMASSKDMSATNPEHVRQYFTSFLPGKLASNMARLHNLGLAHTHPVIGNVNLLGGLVDLDSIQGEALDLGDEKVTAKNFMTDIDSLLSDGPPQHNISGVFRHAESIGLLPPLGANFQDFISTFYNQYLSQRNLDPSNFEQALELLKTIPLRDITFTERVKDIVESSLSTVTNDKVNPGEIHTLAGLLQSITPELVFDVAKTLDLYHAPSAESDFRGNLQSLNFDELRSLRDSLMFAVLSDSVMSMTEDQAVDLAGKWGLTAEEVRAISCAHGLVLVAQAIKEFELDAELQETADSALKNYLTENNMSPEEVVAEIRSIDTGVRTQEPEFVTVNGHHMELKCGVSLSDLLRTIDFNHKKREFLEPSENVFDSYKDGEELPVMVVSGQSIRSIGKSKPEVTNSPDPIQYGDLFVVTGSGQIDYLAFIGRSEEQGKLSIKIQAKTEDYFPETVSYAIREWPAMRALLRIRTGVG